MPKDLLNIDGQKKPGMKLLFADDEKSLRELMSLELPRMGHQVTVCEDGVTAASLIEKNTYDCILVDLDMPGLSGIEVIARTIQESPDTDAIILTGKGTLESAIEALRYGAFDYLTKPCRLIELESVLKQVMQRRELHNKYRAVKRQLDRLEGCSDLIGKSASMESLRRMIGKVAPTNSTILIHGETGTGKELVARAIHDQSFRSDKPFVAVNCGALPENLIESELFGHRKGAFTGADEHRIGLFQVADGGTLFLDEIGEMPQGVQAKLLRFLESGEVRRIGENDAFTCNVRVVCATHRDLSEMVREERFRQDLWYRINTFELEISPLRDRIEDIPLLATHLIMRHKKIAGNDILFTDQTLNLLASHDWPGNVRELANVVEHALILSDQFPIGPESLPSRLASSSPSLALFSQAGQQPDDTPRSLREIEIEAIYEALQRNQGSKPNAADELGISLKTLYNKLNQATAQNESA